MTMIRRASFVTALAAATIQLMSCQNKARFDPKLAGAFFPLNPGSTWTYRVVDERLGITNIITDRAVDKQLISNVKSAGEAVSEGFVSGGASKSTILYEIEGGYINRVSIDGPTWIRFEETRFLPKLLKPDLPGQIRYFLSAICMGRSMSCNTIALSWRAATLWFLPGVSQAASESKQRRNTRGTSPGLPHRCA